VENVCKIYLPHRVLRLKPPCSPSRLVALKGAPDADNIVSFPLRACQSGTLVILRVSERARLPHVLPLPVKIDSVAGTALQSRSQAVQCERFRAENEIPVYTKAKKFRCQLWRRI